MNRDLSEFKGSEYSIRMTLRIIIWNFCLNVFFKNFFFPSPFRVGLLRVFGAKIGKGVYIRRGVTISFPWNLEIGSNSWIGEDVCIINHVRVLIRDNVCISQRAMVASSSHSPTSISLKYSHQEVTIESGVWVCMGAKVLAGSTLRSNSVLSAGEVLKGELHESTILIHGEMKKLRTLERP